MELSALNRAVPRLLYINRIDQHNALEPDQSYARRVTEHYEIDLITGGHGYMETDRCSQETAPGMVFFRIPGMTVRGWGGYYCYHAGFCLEGIAQPAAVPLPPVTMLQNPGVVQGELAQLYRAYWEGSEALELLAKKCLLAVLYALFEVQRQAACRRQSGGSCAQAALEAAAYMRTHPTERRSLQQLAEAAHVSKYHFCRTFKAMVGEPPAAFANRCRVREAQRQLLETDHSLQEIMDACGYCNEAQFYQMFRQYIGDTPAHYRREHSLR